MKMQTRFFILVITAAFVMTVAAPVMGSQDNLKKRIIILSGIKRNGFGPKFKAVNVLQNYLEGQLAAKGFRVFLPEVLADINEEAVLDLARDSASALKFGKQHKADLVITFMVELDIFDEDEGFKVLSMKLYLKAYDCTTGAVLAQSQAKKRKLSREGRKSMGHHASRLALKIGSPLIDELALKIKNYLDNQPAFVVVFLHDIPGRTQFKVEKILRKLGWEYRISKQAGKMMELEIFIDKKPTDVRFELMDNFDKDGIAVLPESINGSRITFGGSQ
jgi:hypothetical protein